jgi:hypothetical protein
MERMDLVAVITADIVNSTKLGKTEYKKLTKALETILQPHQYEFYRGDSFQVLVKSPQEALKILLQARTTAMKTSGTSMPVSDVRASIGLELIKLPVKTFQTASGEAFVLSGRNFDSMPKEERLSVVSNEKNKAVNLGLQLVSRFTDYLFQRLTFKQAAVIHELLMERTQTETAKRIKKSQATVHKHAQSASWPEIEKLLTDYKNLIALI